MSDSVDKNKRSEVMKAVKSKGNKSTELKLITLFKENGIKGWRRGYPVKGHPDFVFLEKRVAVFVDGCLWHGHSCRHWPKSNVEFWKSKIEGSDMVKAHREMSLFGYDVYRFGGYEFFGASSDEARKKEVLDALKQFFIRLFRKYGVIHCVD